METVLIFVGIPAGFCLFVAAVVYAGGARRSRRYRPGRPFEFTPVWFLAAPERLADTAAGAHKPALTAADRAAITAGPKPSDVARAEEWPPVETAQLGISGGASDRW